MARAAAINPPLNCRLCPRLVDFRNENKKAFPDFFNGPVPSFGDSNAKLLIVGLAPGLRGANRTGRPFTGDYAGDLLYETLSKFGFSNGEYKADPDDGLTLNETMITNAVRCLPPLNKPIGAEIRTCRKFLTRQLGAFTDLRAILCLGRIAHESTLATLGIRQKDAPFVHRARHELPDSPFCLFDSYHCSRYNTNTRRLTTEMFEDVFKDIRRYIDGD